VVKTGTGQEKRGIQITTVVMPRKSDSSRKSDVTTARFVPVSEEPEVPPTGSSTSGQLPSGERKGGPAGSETKDGAVALDVSCVTRRDVLFGKEGRDAAWQLTRSRISISPSPSSHGLPRASCRNTRRSRVMPFLLCGRVPPCSSTILQLSERSLLGSKRGKKESLTRHLQSK
jgi:hypothetical protein